MQLVVTKANSLQAFQWVKSGWRLFTQQPAPFMAMSGIILAISLVANFVPLLSFFIVFLMPFLTAGYYQCASNVEQGEKIQAADLFMYLSKISEYSVFMRIAVVSILLSLPASSAAGAIMEGMQQGQQPEFYLMVTFVGFMALNFMLTSFAIPAAWVSPKTPVAQLIKQSFIACWVNVLPLTIYGLLMMLVFFISMPVILIGWLVAMAIGSLSFYQMFLDFYQPEKVDSIDTEQSEGATINAEWQEVTPDKDIAESGVKEVNSTDVENNTDETKTPDLSNSIDLNETETTEKNGAEKDTNDRTDHRQN